MATVEELISNAKNRIDNDSGMNVVAQILGALAGAQSIHVSQSAEK